MVGGSLKLRGELTEKGQLLVLSSSIGAHTVHFDLTGKRAFRVELLAMVEECLYAGFLVGASRHLNQ